MKPKNAIRSAFLLLSSSAAVTQFCYSQTVAIDPGSVPAEYGSPVQAWEFNTDGNPEGWTGTNYGPLTVAGGSITGDTTSGDPQLGQTFTTSIPLGYGTIVEYKMTIDPHSIAPVGGTLFWSDYSGGISAARSVGVTIPEDNTPHVVRVTFPGGITDLKGLRLDSNGGGFPKTVSFDYVRIYAYQPTTFTNVTLTANDASGFSSMNTAGGWNSAAAPTTASNYFTGAFQLRSPGGTGVLPFGGSSLSVDTGGSLLLKGSGTAEIRKLTLAGGSLIQGATGATPDTARLYVPSGIPVTAASVMDLIGPNRSLEITGSLSGSAALNITAATAPAAAQNSGQVVLKSDNTSYTGTLTVESNTWLDLDHDNAVAGANVVVNSGGVLRRSGTDANGTTTAASWAISGRGNTVGNDATKGAIYFNQNGLDANLVGNIAISGTDTRIGSYSASGTLAIDGDITGTGNLELWGGGAAESHIQTFILNGASTIVGQTSVLSDGGAQTHLRLGGDDRLATDQKLRLNATWGPTTAEGAGVFIDMKGYDQKLSALQLDGAKRKTIYDTTLSGTSTLTLTSATNAIDTNGGNIYINGITINQTVGATPGGATIDGGSVVTLTDSTWDSSFYPVLGSTGSGSLVLVNSKFTFGGELLMGRSNNVGTLTVDANSSVSTVNFLRIGDSITGSATVNLNGGTLAAKRFFNNSTGASNLKLNGGTLRATGKNTVDWIEGGTNGVTVTLASGGITLNSDTYTVTAAADILEDAGSTGGGLTKSGTGTTYLDGANTYTGATSVTEGTLGGNGSVTSNVTVASGAGLAFLVTDPGGVAGTGYSDLDITGTLTVPSSLVIKIDSAGVVFPETASTGLVLVTASGGISGFGAVTFDLTDFTGTGTWSAYKDGNSIKLNYTVGAATNTYADWLSANSPATGFHTDTDNDGVPNGVENILGTNPNTFSPGLTQVSATASSVTFQHTLNPTIASDVSYIYEWSSDLTEWKPSGVANTAGTIGTIVASPPASGVVTVTTTRSGTASAKMFTRIKAGNP